MADVKVNWSELHKYPPSTCFCRCVEWPGAPFVSHAKFVAEKEFKGMVSERPCPKCGRNDTFYSVESAPERFDIR